MGELLGECHKTETIKTLNIYILGHHRELHETVSQTSQTVTKFPLTVTQFHVSLDDRLKYILSVFIVSIW